MKSNQTIILTLIAAVLAVAALEGWAANKEVVNVSASPHVKFRTIGLDEARWTGGFWGERWEQDCRVTIPTMKQVLELPTNSTSFHNLRIAASEIQGKFFGNKWGDGDCYKWIEAAASIYTLNHDPELDRQMDEVIAVIAKAPAPDGYISTQIQLTDKGRWTDLNNHKLNTSGFGKKNEEVCL